MIEVYFNKWIPANPSNSDGSWEKGFPNKGFFMYWNPMGDMAAIKTADDMEIYVPKKEVSFMDPRWDWEQRRYELAKAAMQGLLGEKDFLPFSLKIESNFRSFKTTICELSIQLADEMIEQLQKPKP